MCRNAFTAGAVPQTPLEELRPPAAFRGGKIEMENEREGKWRRKKERGMAQEKLCSSKNSYKIITVIMCSRHRRRLVARCAIHVP